MDTIIELLSEAMRVIAFLLCAFFFLVAFTFTAVHVRTKSEYSKAQNIAGIIVLCAMYGFAFALLWAVGAWGR